MKTKIEKTLTNVVLATSIITSTIGTLGCVKQPQNHNSYISAVKRNAESLTDRINKIAVYGPFKYGRMNYKTFSEITSISQTLEQEYNTLPVWINVKTTGSTIEQQIVKESEESTGYIRIDIPYEQAQETLSKLTFYKNKYLGIKPLSIEELTKEPGGY